MVKVGDFIKIHYTGKLQDGTVFDTTDAKQAPHLEGTKPLGPVTICVGERMLIAGLDDALIGKSGKFSVTVPAENAFGKKDPKLLKIVPTEQLHQQQINPTPGLQLNIDGQYGVVRSSSGGRTVVDFNHPLASQDVTYDVEILGKIEDGKEQIKALLDPIGLPYTTIHVEGTKALIQLPQLYPQPVLDAVNERIAKLTHIKTVTFEQGKSS
jgi:FKBP-type peptidyl-prolyl cis-trans isomerase 2